MSSGIQTWRALVLLVALSGVSALRAESICSRGPRGNLQMPCTRFINTRTQFRFTPLGGNTPDLVADNGNLFENSQPPRQLMVDLRPGPTRGQIIGASNGNVVNQVLDHLGRIVSSLQGPAKDIAQLVLTRHGRNPNGNGIGGGPLAQNPQGPGAEPREEHGQGGESSTAPGRRPALDTSRLVDTAGRATPEVCRDLHAAVCGDSNREADRKADDSRVRDVLRSFRSTAGIGFDAFVGAMQGILDAQPSKSVVAPNQQSFDIFSKLTSFLTTGQAGVPSMDKIKSAMGEVKKNLLAAIDKMEFPNPGDKKAMQDKVNATKLRMTPNLTSFSSIKEFVEGCGPDGMTVSAFALPGTNEMVVCPGLLLSSASQGELVDSLIHVAAHEWGHDLHIPKRARFARMEQCLMTEFKKKGLQPKQVEESVADTIGAEAVAERVKGKSAAETLKILRQSTNILCFTSGKDRDGGADEHPPGAFRINFLIGRNPGIREALGCGAPSEQEPVCLVQGRVPAASK